MHPRLKPLYKAQKQVRRRLMEDLESIYFRFNLARAFRHASSTLTANGMTAEYLREQLGETLRKKRLMGRQPLQVVPLVDMLAERYDFAGRNVLCVGCRDTDEIRYFRKRGAAKVIGIDLYSDDPDIQVMDMHDLKFPDDGFDVVYSRHSFEHSYDTAKAAREFVRVLRDQGVVVIEVPGRYKGGADYNRFDGIDDVMNAFGTLAGKSLMKDYSRKEDNQDGMDIIRVMFHVDKTKAS